MRSLLITMLSLLGASSWIMSCASSASRSTQSRPSAESSVVSVINVPIQTSIEPLVTYAFPPEVSEEQPEPPSGMLIEVMQKALPRTPDRFDPKGRFVATLENGQCDVWDIESGLYAGQVPEVRCLQWREPGIEKFSPNRHYQIDVSTPVVKVVSRLAPNAPKILDDECGTKCTPVVALRWNVDSTKIAFAREDDSHVRVFDVQSAKLEATLDLAANESVMKEQIAWGAKGLVVATTKIDKPTSDEPTKPLLGIKKTKIYAWASLQAKPTVEEIVVSNAMEDGLDTMYFQLEPLSRFYMQVIHQHRSGNGLIVSEVGTQRRVNLSWSVKIAKNESETLASSYEGQTWLPGPYPAWESILKSVHYPDPPTRDAVSDGFTYEAVHIYTAPNCTRVRPKTLSPSSCVRKVVKNGCDTIDVSQEPCPARTENALDPSGRWKGTGPYSIQRLSDGEEITYNWSGFEMKTGVSDSHHAVHKRVYRLGNDPLNSPLIQGQGRRISSGLISRVGYA